MEIKEILEWLNKEGFVIATYIEGNKHPVEVNDSNRGILSAFETRKHDRKTCTCEVCRNLREYGEFHE